MLDESLVSFPGKVNSFSDKSVLNKASFLDLGPEVFP